MSSGYDDGSRDAAYETVPLVASADPQAASVGVGGRLQRGRERITGGGA
jgi:hypothetical protein